MEGLGKSLMQHSWYKYIADFVNAMVTKYQVFHGHHIIISMICPSLSILFYEYRFDMNMKYSKDVSPRKCMLSCIRINARVARIFRLVGLPVFNLPQVSRLLQGHHHATKEYGRRTLPRHV